MGGTFVGKRDTEKLNFQANDTMMVDTRNVSSRAFVGKRDSKRVKRQREKRQWTGNTANVKAGTINGGNFIGKRDTN